MTTIFAPPEDRTYSKEEVEALMIAHANGMRKAFDELQQDLEKSYTTEVERLQAYASDELDKWPKIRRWSTWGGWACFWISGFCFRPFFDLAWR